MCQNVESTYKMFNGALSSFDQGIKDWDVCLKVTHMAFMFGGATSFNQPIETGMYLR